MQNFEDQADVFIIYYIFPALQLTVMYYNNNYLIVIISIMPRHVSFSVSFIILAHIRHDVYTGQCCHSYLEEVI